MRAPLCLQYIYHNLITLRNTTVTRFNIKMSPYQCINPIVQIGRSKDYLLSITTISYPSKIDSQYNQLSTFRHALSPGFLYQTVFPGSGCNVKQSDPCDSSCSSHVSVTGSCIVAKQLSDWLHRNRQLGKYDGRGKVDEFVDVPVASDASQKLCTVHWDRAAATQEIREINKSVIFWKTQDSMSFLYYLCKHHRGKWFPTF